MNDSTWRSSRQQLIHFPLEAWLYPLTPLQCDKQIYSILHSAYTGVAEIMRK